MEQTLPRSHCIAGCQLVFRSCRSSHCRPVHVSRQACSSSSALPRAAVLCQAQKKGFGTSSKSKSKRGRSGPALQESNPEWVPIAMVSEFKEGKQTLPKILRDNSAIVLYRVDDEVYCSDANSTAFKFPLIDANIIEREEGPAVEVPLDGTVYDLETGKVLEWCPKNNPVRFLLGSLKAKSQPENLRVYPARVNSEGKIFVKFSTN